MFQRPLPPSRLHPRRIAPSVLPLVLFAAAGCSTPGRHDESARAADKEHVCSSCHGIDGNSVSPTFPHLAGQQRDYLVAQLKAFRDHSRADAAARTYMWGMAADLTDADIDTLADYYSRQGSSAGSPGDRR